MMLKLKNTLALSTTRALSFVKENRGSVSVEFAFIMPLLITLWLGTIEVSEGLEVNKKVGRAASTIGDLVAQEEDIDVSELQAIMAVGNSQLLPYGRSTPTFRVVGVKVDADGDATVAWSYEKTGVTFSVPLVKDSDYDIPAKVAVAGSFLVEVSAQLEFLPLTSWSIQKNKGSGDSSYAAVDMKESYYFRPRQGDQLLCDDCPDPS